MARAGLSWLHARRVRAPREHQRRPAPEAGDTGISGDCRQVSSLAVAEERSKAAGPAPRGPTGEETPRPAATVMVVRDVVGASLEVLLVRRSLRAAFVGGAYVFPGGVVDPGDAGPRAERLSCGRSDADASAVLGVGSGGLSYWIAAIRECFEEAGLLLACGVSGEPVVLSTPAAAARFARHRALLNARQETFLDICEVEGLRLLAGELAYFAHWITPEGSSRRYDTRFFVAAAPPGQAPAHDARETVAHLWVRPAEALERHRSGEIDLVLPTIRNLQAIAAFATTAELLDAASSQREVAAVLPRVVVDGGVARLLVPGDPGCSYPAELAGGAVGTGSSPTGFREGEGDVGTAIRLASFGPSAPCDARGGAGAPGPRSHG